jgi:hypothetical protein
MAGSPAPVAGLEVDELEVRTLAAYGEIPVGALQTPRYAWRVFNRKKELQQLHKEQKALHADATKLLKEELAAEVDTITARGEGAAMGSFVETLKRADQIVATRRKALAEAQGQTAAQFQSLGGDIQREQEARKVAVKATETAQIHLEDATQKRTRVVDELRRLEDALGDAHEEASVAAGAGDFAPPAHARRIKKIEARVGEVAKLKEGHDQSYADAKRKLRSQNDAVRDVDNRIKAIRSREHQAETAASQTHSAGAEALAVAQLARLDGYARVLERIEQEMPKLITSEIRQRIAQARAGLQQVDCDLEKHARAIEAFDKDSFNKGLGIVIGVAVVILLILISAARVG